MGPNLRVTHLTSNVTPFMHMNFSRMNLSPINGVPLKLKIKELVIEWLSICSKCIDLSSLNIFFEYQEWLNVISTLVFGVPMRKN
jgi:hypothetical protein